MPVGEVCNRAVPFTAKDASLFEAAYIMRSRHIGELIVVDLDDRKVQPIGIITDRDIFLGVLTEGRNPETLSVADVMNGNPLVAEEEDGVWETLQSMRAKGVQHIPVVNKQRNLTGILTLVDLLELLARELTELIRSIKQEQNRPVKTRH